MKYSPYKNKQLKINYVVENGNIQIRTIQKCVKKLRNDNYEQSTREILQRVERLAGSVLEPYYPNRIIIFIEYIYISLL